MSAVVSTPNSVVITAPNAVELVIPAALAAMVVVEDEQISTVFAEVAQTVATEVTHAAVVSIGQLGMRGPRGPVGPVGPASPGSTYTFNQNVPATTWVISHNLGQFPSVTVVDTAGSVVNGAVSYLDGNNIQLDFTYAQSGVAYLN